MDDSARRRPAQRFTLQNRDIYGFHCPGIFLGRALRYCVGGKMSRAGLPSSVTAVRRMPGAVQSIPVVAVDGGDHPSPPPRDKRAMRVLMFGWEFPPFVAGGLATATLG